MQTVFSSTITTLCQLTSVQVRDNHRCIHPRKASGACAYNKIALLWGEPKICATNDEHDT